MATSRLNSDDMVTNHAPPHLQLPRTLTRDGWPAQLLVVDDDHFSGDAIREFGRREGWEVRTAKDAESALDLIATSEATESPIDVVLCDVSLPDRDGHELLAEVRRQRRAVATVMMTGYGSVDSAVAALRLGAVDYLTKPIVDEELRQALARALQQRELLRENQGLRRRVGIDPLSPGGASGVVGDDPRMLRVFELIRAVAPARTTVLMSGESGTGKSRIAHAIHSMSPRREKPFVELSCGSIPETLLESELFGHVKGAFTGAHADKAGRFLAANQGTLFLDEINSASPGMQLKLLRVLQERRFEPVGSTTTIEVDVRVVLASNQPLEQLVAAGQFRQDLYYRINVMKVELPPLRERRSDVAALAHHFLQLHSLELQRTIVSFSPQAMSLLCGYSFPGNIRELSNIVEHAAVLCKGHTIEVEDLPEFVVVAIDVPSPATNTAKDTGNEVWNPQHPQTLEMAMRDPERKIILAALHANGWNRQKTADILAVNRTTLYKRMKLLALDGRAA